jgi:hypothetical protein
METSKFCDKAGQGQATKRAWCMSWWSDVKWQWLWVYKVMTQLLHITAKWNAQSDQNFGPGDHSVIWTLYCECRISIAAMQIVKNEISNLHFLCSVLGDKNSALAFTLQIIVTVSGSRSPLPPLIVSNAHSPWLKLKLYWMLSMHVIPVNINFSWWRY